MKFHKNIGNKDRIFRLVIALILGVLCYFEANLYLRIALGLGALFTLFEATFSWCAFYQLIGRNTCPIK